VRVRSYQPTKFNISHDTKIKYTSTLRVHSFLTTKREPRRSFTFPPKSQKKKVMLFSIWKLLFRERSTSKPHETLTTGGCLQQAHHVAKDKYTIIIKKGHLVSNLIHYHHHHHHHHHLSLFPQLSKYSPSVRQPKKEKKKNLNLFPRQLDVPAKIPFRCISSPITQQSLRQTKKRRRRSESQAGRPHQQEKGDRIRRVVDHLFSLPPLSSQPQFLFEARLYLSRGRGLIVSKPDFSFIHCIHQDRDGDHTRR
jgi:hypothetical protein